MIEIPNHFSANAAIVDKMHPDCHRKYVLTNPSTFSYHAIPYLSLI